MFRLLHLIPSLSCSTIHIKTFLSSFKAGTIKWPHSELAALTELKRPFVWELKHPASFASPSQSHIWKQSMPQTFKSLCCFWVTLAKGKQPNSSVCIFLWIVDWVSVQTPRENTVKSTITSSAPSSSLSSSYLVSSASASSSSTSSGRNSNTSRPLTYAHTHIHRWIKNLYRSRIKNDLNRWAKVNGLTVSDFPALKSAFFFSSSSLALSICGTTEASLTYPLIWNITATLRLKSWHQILFSQPSPAFSSSSKQGKSPGWSGSR